MTHMLMILLLSLICGALIALMLRATGEKSGYDERQVAAQGTAYRAGFYVLLIYNLIGGSFCLLFDWHWAANEFVFAAVGALAAMAVMVGIMIWNHSYLRRKDRAVVQHSLLGVLGVIQLLLYATNTHYGNPAFKDGKVQLSILQLGLGIVLLITTVVWLLRFLLDRRAERSEEEE